MNKDSGPRLIGKAIPLMALILFVHMGPGILSAQGDCWNIFRGNQALQGVSRSDVPVDFSILWTFPTGGEIKSSPVVCGEDLVIGSTDGTVYCLSTSGSLRWKFPTGNAIEAGALILDGTVYIGNLDGTFYALDLETGEKKWEYRTENQIIGSANWIRLGNRTVLFVGSYDYYLHGIDAATGKGLWKYESDNFINGAASLYKGYAVFGGCDGFLHLVDLKNGALRDRIELATYIAGSASIIGDRAYIGDYDGVFRCVDLEGKKTVWEWKEEDSFLPFIASPAVDGDLVITGNENKYIYCFNRITGDPVWKVNTRARVHASPVIAGNHILAANLRGDVFLIDLKTGKTLKEYELGQPISSNPSVYRGRIYIGTGDGTVYCLGKK
jgi:outer membrane protein assembly factor BamB